VDFATAPSGCAQNDGCAPNDGCGLVCFAAVAAFRQNNNAGNAGVVVAAC